MANKRQNTHEINLVTAGLTGALVGATAAIVWTLILRHNKSRKKAEKIMDAVGKKAEDYIDTLSKDATKQMEDTINKTSKDVRKIIVN